MSTVPFVDMHCDTLMQSWFRHKKDIYRTSTMLDVEKLQRGGGKAQFFAIYLQSMRLKRVLGPLLNDDRYIETLMKTFYNTLQKHGDVVAYAGNYQELEKNWQEGKVSAFLSMEDGRAVEGKMEKLQEYYDKGVRMLGLTWNFANCFGYPNSPDATIMKKGLSAFGKEAVEEMNRLGMIVDVSHLSDGGFWDVVSISKKPFVASHSDARALCNHTRNLSDKMIRAVGEAGGVIGMNQCPEFLYPDSRENRIEDMVKHLLHIRNVGGREVAALGSDFDGITGRFAIEGPHQYQKLAGALAKAGLSGEEIDEIFFKNVERVIKDVMK